MTIRHITSSISVTANGADAITANSFDTIIVETGVIVSATGGFGAASNSSIGIVGTAGTESVDVSVFGTIIASHAGIRLEDAPSSHSVFVGAGGRVQSELTGVLLNGTYLSFENNGLIRAGSFGVYLTGVGSTVLNSATISVLGGTAVGVAAGDVDLVNTGTISAFGGLALADIGNGVANVWNSGLMVGGIGLGNGNDIYQGGGRVVNGYIDGAGGNDTIIGGISDDTIYDRFGSNWLAGGDGADLVQISVPSDISLLPSHLFGGISGGADTSSHDTISIDFSSIAGNIFLSSGAATGSVTRTSDGAVTAWINGFENAVGSIMADAIFGSAGANMIEGGNGGDWMVGNGGADRFVFNFVSHADAGDQIRDFRRSEGDRIDLSGMDADTITTGNDTFAFRTTHTSNAAGEAVITNFGNSARIDLYVNADNIVDGTFVVVYGEAGVTNLTAADFLL